ncbi:mannose-6-phosphate isomerase [Cephus cinctus]|uniref:Mannose-6-phosphate isomerase n=1 Tax=Cephus cinctus TaxID=211228 RepID=A0AAJ7BYE2_CEPCN|nr:mannose-6-phosphate isomerase [Cephus cinctus]XP_015597341.1 mannose-6-phosphate isomerase [Cephus cinctus]XP_015597350.1 mannose-6-phosphate isomerase [Cephus cinctus]XP_015597359.1 mannose-6-phosphate isomerase [Cephus cinctus]XP_024941975.1 mannose-6-phosphate isomerase [Cephus cinctus]
MELKCMVQSYDWGKHGIDSTVATLTKSANTDFILDETKPYAELWMGTHPNGPSYLKKENKSLDSYIKENKEVLGVAVEEKFGIQLPFLFKILSVNKALSIQAHPNKERAVQLHRSHPDIYKDPNHKPELAIALTPFEALCGFRPISEIKQYLKSVPELRTIIGEDKVLELMTMDEAGLPAALKKCFQNFINCDPGVVALQLRKLLDRIASLDESTRQILNANLLERLHSEYPGDIGCFGIYLFNFITLQPGEAIYLGPNEPHAYLSGDCVECMACSDNVIRAGLTPKLKDVTTLVEMLTYNCEPSSAKRFQPSREDECSEIFRPPVPDFAVVKITIPPGRALYNLIPRSTASILIIINGKAEISPLKILNRGSVLFIPANEKVIVKVLCGCHPMLMFQALPNV